MKTIYQNKIINENDKIVNYKTVEEREGDIVLRSTTNYIDNHSEQIYDTEIDVIRLDMNTVENLYSELKQILLRRKSK